MPHLPPQTGSVCICICMYMRSHRCLFACLCVFYPPNLSVCAHIDMWQSQETADEHCRYTYISLSLSTTSFFFFSSSRHFLHLTISHTFFLLLLISCTFTYISPSQIIVSFLIAFLSPAFYSYPSVFSLSFQRWLFHCFLQCVCHSE